VRIFPSVLLYNFVRATTINVVVFDGAWSRTLILVSVKLTPSKSILLIRVLTVVAVTVYLQWFDAVDWVTGRAPGL